LTITEFDEAVRLALTHKAMIAYRINEAEYRADDWIIISMICLYLLRAL